MKTSTETNELFTALALAQGEIEGAEKDGKNPHFGNKYATLTSVIDAVKKPLAKYNLAIIQSPDCDPESPTPKIWLSNRLVHKSGQWLETQYFMKPQQDTPQAWGSAITYARRYCLMAILGVPAEDDDGDAAPQPRASSQSAQNNFNRQNPPMKKTGSLSPLQKHNITNDYSDIPF